MNNLILGIDEAATGTFVGNMYVAGVLAPKDWLIPGLKDSKKTSKEERAGLHLEIMNCEDIKVLILPGSNESIDREGLKVIHKKLISQICYFYNAEADEIVIDGNVNPKHYQKYETRECDWSKVKSVIKADSKYPTVMAASIIAKFYKDCEMENNHRLHPQYGWNTNSGYLTKDHQQAIVKYGLTQLHRKSYKMKFMEEGK